MSNPCQELADFFKGFTKSEHLQKGIFGGVTYISYIESGNSAYEISCFNTIPTLKLTNVSVKQRFTGAGFTNYNNISTNLDHNTGLLSMKDIFGNNTTIMLPIPDGKFKK